MRTGFRPCVVFMPVLLLVVGVAAWSATALARQGGVADGVLAGTVTSDNGPEAGVWVIAETNELETKFAKIVVDFEERPTGSWVRFSQYGELPEEHIPLAKAGMDSYFQSLADYLG